MYALSSFFSSSGDHRDLHSFPTRRSSDLKAPNVVPNRAVAEFWIRYPDPVYLAQVTDRVNDAARGAALATGTKRSEEHTSELQSHSDLVCRLLLEKKKKKHTRTRDVENYK